MESLRIAQSAILAELRTLQGLIQGAMSTALIAERVGCPERTARYHLQALEWKGLVERPRGVKSGWQPVDSEDEATALPTPLRSCGTRSRVMAALIETQMVLKRPVPTTAISARVPVSRRMVQYHLRTLELSGVIIRPRGKHQGWLYKAQPFDDVLLGHLRQAQRDVHGPVRTVTLAARAGMPERTATHYLRRMELAGLVSRPAGPKSGWLCIEREWPGWAALEAA